MIKLEEIEKVKLSKLDIEVVPFLKIDDVAYIGKQVMTRMDYAERKLLKEMLILEKCTDIKDLENQDYDALKYNGVIDAVLAVVRNAGEIDEYVAHQESFNIEVGAFLQELIKLCEKAVKKIPTGKKWDEIMNMIPQLINKK